MDVIDLSGSVGHVVNSLHHRRLAAAAELWSPLHMTILLIVHIH